MAGRYGKFPEGDLGEVKRSQIPACYMTKPKVRQGRAVSAEFNHVNEYFNLYPFLLI